MQSTETGRPCHPFIHELLCDAAQKGRLHSLVLAGLGIDLAEILPAPPQSDRLAFQLSWGKLRRVEQDQAPIG